MLKIILPFFICLFACPLVFALDCPDDEKFIPIQDNQIGYSMYDYTMYANKLEKCKGTDCDLYTGGEWKVKNISSDNLNVVGKSLCLDSDDFNKKTSKTGSYCHCSIQELDNYPVLADWINVKVYERNVFDEDKKYFSEHEKKQERQRINDKNTQECMDNCSRDCQSNLSKLIKVVHGYYVCDKALYKTSEVICVIDSQIIKAKTISVFDDIAEIKTKNESIIFYRDKKDSKNLIYVGSYDYTDVYLKVDGNKIYVGTKSYSMEECL